MKNTKALTQLAVKVIGGLALIGGAVAVLLGPVLKILPVSYTNVVILAFTLAGFLVVWKMGILNWSQLYVSGIWIFLVATAAVFLPYNASRQLPAWILGQSPLGAQTVAMVMVFGLIINIKLYETQGRHSIWLDVLLDLVLLLPVILSIN